MEKRTLVVIFNLEAQVNSFESQLHHIKYDIKKQKYDREVE